MNHVKRLVSLLIALPTLAAAAPPAPPPPAAPSTQPQAAPDAGGEPDLGPNVVIKPREGQPMIQEYQVNDRTFMIKITPAKGFSYYLVDMDGDGRLETRRNVLQPDFLVPQWTLFSW